jgi:hypothetical protein
MTKQEAKNLIERHHLDIPELQYGHFKFQVQNVEQSLADFETRWADEPSTVNKLKEHLKGLDVKLV